MVAGILCDERCDLRLSGRLVLGRNVMTREGRKIIRSVCISCYEHILHEWFVRIEDGSMMKICEIE